MGDSFSIIGSDGMRVPETFDAQAWAREFVAMAMSRPKIATEEDTMIGWFANAIMAGYDHARRENRSA